MSKIPEELKQELNEKISILETLEAYLLELMHITEFAQALIIE